MTKSTSRKRKNQQAPNPDHGEGAERDLVRLDVEGTLMRHPQLREFVEELLPVFQPTGAGGAFYYWRDEPRHEDMHTSWWIKGHGHLEIVYLDLIVERVNAHRVPPAAYEPPFSEMPGATYGAERELLDRCLTYLREDHREATATERGFVTRESLAVFKKPRPVGYNETFERTPEPPAVLLPGIIPFDVFTFIGTGGTAKTTILIFIMIHIVLGQSIFGVTPTKAGPCLLVTAEDDVDILRYRLRRLCDAIGLSDQERRVVGRNLYIDDCVGSLARLVEADAKGNLSQTQHAEDLVAVYKDRSLVLCCFDPVVYFSAGERSVNDGDSTLLAVARQVSRGLGGAAVGLVHHVSKVSAQDRNPNQHAGRGGSALADNARAVLQLIHHDNLKDRKYPRPEAITDDDVRAFRVLRLHVTKFSHGRRASEPFWLLRPEHDGFNFRVFEAPPRAASERTQDAAVRRQAVIERTEILHQVVAYVATEAYPSSRSIAENCTVSIDGKRVGRQRIRDIVKTAIEDEVLVQLDLPVSRRRGAARTYVATGRFDPPTAEEALHTAETAAAKVQPRLVTVDGAGLAQ